MNHNCNLDVLDLKELTLKIQQSFGNIDDKTLKWSLLKEYKSKFLDDRHYCQPIVTSYISVVSTLLDSLKPRNFVEKNDYCVLDDIVLYGIQHESFLLLINRLNTNDSFAEKTIVKLLQMFFQTSSFEALLMYQCQNHFGWELKYVSQSNIWNTLITGIISLPERIANKTRGKFVKIFSPNCYIPLIISSVFKVLSSIHTCLENSQDCSVEFLAKLIGRICIIGNADIVAKKFSKELVSATEKDFIWRRISQNFIGKIPSNSIDSFMTNLLLIIPWYGYVEWILGDEGVKNEKINYLMTVKILFVKVYNKDLILQNTIGYFASSSDRLPQFWKIINSLLDSWMDKRSLLCQNAEQKMYIASVLMVCAGWLPKFKNVIDTNLYISKILQGTQIRLESSEEVVRSQGMVIGEHLIKAIDSNSPALKFEFKDSPMLNHLKSLSEIPEKPVSNTLNDDDLKCFEEAEKERLKEEIHSNMVDPKTTDELDSDDELEPYDMSNDVPAGSVKRPLYLRDCLKGLIQQEDADFTEQCLLYAEELIKNNAYAVHEVSEEMSKVLLHMDDKFAITNFIPLRHKILITLTVECPVVVSNYLISQFSARDYNIRQRLDILEVLAASSIALSHSHLTLKEHTQSKSNQQITGKEDGWKLVVQQRLEAKTKRYTKVQQPVLMENKFSVIAGSFFFPLLSCYIKGDSFFDVSKEIYVLGRFIHTLGMIMFAASNTISCRHMGTTFLQFLATIRTHPDVSVRQSVLFGIAATYMSVPCSILLSEMLPEVLDSNEWLQSIVQSDPESSCVEKAIHILSILQSKASESGPCLALGGLVVPKS